MRPTRSPATAGWKYCVQRGKSFEAGTQIADRFGEGDGGEASDDAEHGVGDEFAGALEGGDGNAEERLAAEKPAHDHDAGNGGEHDRAEDAGAPASDDLFDDEEHGGDGSVESGGEAGGCADGSHEAKFFAGDFELAAESGGDAGSDLERRIFGTEGLAGADGERGADEFSDGGAKRDESVEDVERGLGLVHAAAADGGKDMDHERGDDETGERWDCEQAPTVGLREGAEQGEVHPVDGEAEADHGEAGEDSDEDGEDEEEYFFVEDALKSREQAARNWTCTVAGCGDGMGRSLVDEVAHWLAASRF